MTRELLPVASGRDTASTTWAALRRRPGALVGTTLAFVVAGVAGVVPPWAVGRLVDAVRDRGAGVVDARADVVQWGVVIAISAVVLGLATTLATAFLARAAAPALAELREDVLDAALHLDAERIEKAGSGDVVSRVGDDVRQVTESFDEALPLLITSVLAIVFTVLAMAGLDWRLGVAGLVALPFYALGLRWYLPRSAPLYRQERTLQGERAEALVSGLRGATTLRAFGRGADATGRVDVASRDALDVSGRVFVLMTRFWARMNRAELIGLLAVLSAGFWLVDRDLASVGEATAAALYFHRLFNPIGAVLMVFDDIQSAGASLARLAGVARLGVHRSPVERAGAALDLRITGLRHAYGDREVLHGVDLHVRPGSRVALVGRSGAGKTTAAAIAAGQLVAGGGQVTTGGVVRSPEDLRRQVALVTQEVHVFSGTLRDNLTLARSDADDDAVWAALDLVGAGDWVRSLPDQLDARVGATGRPVSSAHAQHLALARLVLRDPPLVVLDEATAEAGSAGAAALERGSDAALRGRTALVVAHRLTQAASADHVVVLDEGRVVEQGTHDELVRAGGRYADLWRAWSST